MMFIYIYTLLAAYADLICALGRLADTDAIYERYHRH